MERLKAKVRKSMDGSPRQQDSPSDSTTSGYPSNKPLPSDKALPTPPGHQARPSKPTIRQVNSTGPEHRVDTGNSMQNPRGEASKPELLPELDFDGLNIHDSDDPDDDFYDAQDGSPSKSHRRHGKQASKNFSQAPPIDVLNRDPSAITTAIPDRRSSKRFSGEHGDHGEHGNHVVNSYSPTQRN